MKKHAHHSHGSGVGVLRRARLPMLLLSLYLLALPTSALPQPLPALERLRAQFADAKYKFKPVTTGVSGLPLEKITGGTHLSDAELTTQAQQANTRAQTWLGEEKTNLGPSHVVAAEPECAQSPRYDLRSKGLSTPVQNQQSCGSCWAFAAVAALESSWKKINGQTIGASEQQVLNCGGAAGSCSGGIPTSVFLHLMFQPIPSRNDVPYVGNPQGCNIEARRPYSASIFGFVGTSGVMPKQSEIKEALCEYGALAATMNATEAFQYYGNEGDIFNEMNDGILTNHVVTIIGWDDDKHGWLIKNSWGTDWGIEAAGPTRASNRPRGYAWIDYDSNLIGRSAAWVKARRMCPNDGDYDAGLCYPRCKEGYHGLGPMCWENCPSGMIDDGASCRAPISSMAKKSQSRGVGQPLTCSSDEEFDAGLCYPRCPAGFHPVGPVCWGQCPEGYTDDGATCRRDAHIFGKESFGRGMGSPLPCDDDEEQDAALCYTRCTEGFHGVGPVCWGTCPEGYADDGGTCRRDVKITSKESQGRGVGTPVHACLSGTERDAGLCYPACPAGYNAVGPVCWEICPADYRDDGATCTKGGQVIASKGEGRGVGQPLP